MNLFGNVVLLLLALNVLSDRVIDICDSARRLQCFCDVSKLDVNFPSFDVDCSYSNISITNSNYRLPDNVYFLDLSANNITSLSNSKFLHSKTIKKLFLNKNLISVIQPTDFELPHLIHLDLSENHIETVNAAIFKSVKNLLYLDLSGNKIKTFKPKTFRLLDRLNILILSNNNIGDELIKTNLFQDNGLAINPAIEMLCLDNVGLRIIPENFLSDAFNIRHLTLARNNLSVVPELPFTLEYLDLSDNPITVLEPEDFSNVLALKELLLNNLHIIHIQDYTFASLKCLVRLELKGNRNLQMFSPYAFGVEVLEDSDDFNLRELSLRGSKLNTLDSSLIEPFSRLGIIDLQGNPWTCDCNMAWIKKLQIDSYDYDHIRCFKPSYLYNYRLFELKDELFVCNELYTNFQAIMTFLILATITFLVSLGVWIVFIFPNFSHRKTVIQNMINPTSVSPYSRITIEPNMAEDYR